MTSVILRLQAIDFTTFAQCTASLVMRVPSTSGPPRIQDQHRNILLDGRHDGGRVQHLGAEIGQLGGFGERDGLDTMPAAQNRRDRR